MARLQDGLQDGGDWAGDTIKAVRKLKEIVASDDKQASCASFAASLYKGIVPARKVFSETENHGVGGSIPPLGTKIPHN